MQQRELRAARLEKCEAERSDEHLSARLRRYADSARASAIRTMRAPQPSQENQTRASAPSVTSPSRSPQCLCSAMTASSSSARRAIRGEARSVMDDPLSVSSLDDLVCPQQRARDGEAERFGRLQVDDELEPCGLLDR